MAITTITFTSAPLTVSMGGVFVTEPLGMVPLPATIGATFDLTLPNFANLSFPPWAVDGEGIYEFNAAELSFPPWIVEGEGQVGIVGSADLSFPRWLVDGSAYDIAAEGHVYFPLWQVTGEGIVSIIGSASLVMPRWRVSAEGIHNIIGTAAIAFPSWLVDGYGRRITHIIRKTIAANGLHYGVTEYGGWDFNSYANRNGKLLAANSNGLHEIGGDKDGGPHGLNIDSHIFLGMTDMHKQIMKFAREVWFTVRANGDLALVLRLDEHTEYEYLIERVSGEEHAHELRAKPGRGIRNRYITFGLKNKSGCYFEIDSMRVYADVSDRRIR
jgi:hypothetical protein